MLKDLFTRLFSGPLIAEQPADIDDEVIFGRLPNDIARRTGIFPGHIKREIDTMLAHGNPLATKFATLAQNGGYSPFSSEFGELCALVDKRLDLRFPR